MIQYFCFIISFFFLYKQKTILVSKYCFLFKSICNYSIDLKFYYFNFTLCNRNAFNTTDTELNAIAAPATQGAKKPNAAIGIPKPL